jgi:spermidine/putrescine transport system permease protein
MEARQRSPWMGGIVVLAILFLYLPLVVVVLFSFHETASLSFPFKGFSLRWYESTLQSVDFQTAALNSLYVAIPTAVITLVLGTAAAYGLTRSSSRLRGPLALLFFLPITLPGLFLGIALLVFFARVKVDLSLQTVVIAHLVYVFPYFLLVARAALDRLDPALEEAAADLGASPARVFFRVTLPQVWPILAGATCLAFVLSFDEFVITFFAIGSDSTLPLYIWSSLRRTINPSINVISTLLLVFSLVLWGIAFLLTVRAERRRARSVQALATTKEA